MTFRSDVATAIQSVAQTYATANPTLLKKVTRARPAGFGNTPHAYVGSRPESIVHTEGLRRRTINPQLVVVSAFTDNEQDMDAMDDLADALLDAYTAAPHAISGSTLLEPIGIEDVEDQVGTVSYPGFAITFRAIIQQGRT
jgi:hypothetical protein